MSSGSSKPTVSLAGFDTAEVGDKLSPSLRRVGLGLTRTCNLACVYCLSDAGQTSCAEMKIRTYWDVLKQAINLGVETLVVIGEGEPLCFEGLDGLVEMSTELGLKLVLFTNGTLLSAERVDMLWDAGASVLLKINSLNENVHDSLVGMSGAHEAAMRSVEMLLERGFASTEPTRLGMETVIVEPNLEDIPALWRYCRDRHIFPYFETLRRCGRASRDGQLAVAPQSLRALFRELKTFDTETFGISWGAHPPYVGFSCRQHYYSCFIRANGDVSPCSGIPITVGNILRETLGDILARPLFVRLRRLAEYLNGSCGTCRYRGSCYGCRANALATTGSIFGDDPDCWVNL